MTPKYTHRVLIRDRVLIYVDPWWRGYSGFEDPEDPEEPWNLFEREDYKETQYPQGDEKLVTGWNGHPTREKIIKGCVN